MTTSPLPHDQGPVLFGAFPAWRGQAACLDEDPELFFPIGTTGPALAQAELAKAVCQRCPVIAQCLAWALATRQEAGVWGGLSEDERRDLRRRRRAPRATTRRVTDGNGTAPPTSHEA
ncbi:MAG: WhiB family transcriptional regulator [Egibacteraceae bacterium]